MPRVADPDAGGDRLDPGHHLALARGRADPRGRDRRLRRRAPAGGPGRTSRRRPRRGPLPPARRARPWRRPDHRHRRQAHDLPAHGPGRRRPDHRRAVPDPADRPRGGRAGRCPGRGGPAGPRRAGPPLRQRGRCRVVVGRVPAVVARTDRRGGPGPGRRAARSGSRPRGPWTSPTCSSGAPASRWSPPTSRRAAGSRPVASPSPASEARRITGLRLAPARRAAVARAARYARPPGRDMVGGGCDGRNR